MAIDQFDSKRDYEETRDKHVTYLEKMIYNGDETKCTKNKNI